MTDGRDRPAAHARACMPSAAAMGLPLYRRQRRPSAVGFAGGDARAEGGGGQSAGRGHDGGGGGYKSYLGAVLLYVVVRLLHVAVLLCYIHRHTQLGTHLCKQRRALPSSPSFILGGGHQQPV